MTRRGRWSVAALVATLALAGATGAAVRARHQGARSQALVKAVQDGDLATATRLLREGADPNAHLVYTNSVRGPVDAWRWLVRDREIFWHDAPILCEAAGDGAPNDAAMVAALLDAGAQIDARDDIGWTALFHAATSDRRKIVRLLLARGADRSLRSNRGKTVRDEAERFGRRAVVALLDGGNPR